MCNRKCPKMNLTQKRIEMFYSTNQSHHWKLNQSEVGISVRLANQIARNQPIRRRVTSFTSASEQYIRWHNRHWHSGFFDRPWRCSPVRNVRIYREEKPVTSYEDPSAVNRGLYLWCMWKRFWQKRCQKQTYEDPCRFFTDLQLQYLWQGA